MDTQVVARGFPLGFKTDIPRDQLPEGAAYRMKDYIPSVLKAPLRGRGGWKYGSSDLNSASSSTSQTSLGWFPFQGDPHLISISGNGKVFQIKQFDGAHGSFISTLPFSGLTHEPFFSTDAMIILPPLGSDNLPYWYFKSGGSFTVAAADTDYPHAAVGANWGAYVNLANGYVSGTRYPNRTWWSDPGDVDTWNTGTSFWDLPDEIIKVVPLQNLILYFGYQQTWALIGDTPPPGGNFQMRTIFADNGCMDGRSVAQYKEYVIWANSAGVWKTDGSVLTDLTYRCGIQSYWRELLLNFNTSTGWRAAGGVLYGHYIITITNNSGAQIVTLLFDLEREIAFEFTNFPAAMYARRSSGPGTSVDSGHEELFFGSLAQSRVNYISSCWDPTTNGMQDANGTNVLPVVETPFWKLGNEGQKRMRRAFITYDLGDGGASPSIQVGHVLTPEEGAAYTTATESLSPTTLEARSKRIYINRKGLGIGMKFTQVNRATDNRLATIELEGHGLGPER